MFAVFTAFCNCWGTETHRNIGRHGFEILNNDNVPTASFYFDHNSQFIERIKLGFIDPDWEEKKMGTHYYVWPGNIENTGQYLKNAFFSFTSESARTRYENHYSQALHDYCSGSKESAFLHLGRAGHYLQDIGCPAHSAGIQYPLFGPNDHAMYENYIDGVSSKSQYHATSAQPFYGELDGHRLGFILNQMAERSSRMADKVKSRNDSQYLLTMHAVAMCDQYTAVYLDKFAREAQECEKLHNNITTPKRQQKQMHVETKSSI